LYDEVDLLRLWHKPSAIKDLLFEDVEIQILHLYSRTFCVKFVNLEMCVYVTPTMALPLQTDDFC